jgi:hypothetical protein
MLDLNQYANGTLGQFTELLDEFAKRNPEENRKRLEDALQTTNPFARIVHPSNGIATAEVSDTTLRQWLENAQNEYEYEINLWS